MQTISINYFLHKVHMAMRQPGCWCFIGITQAQLPPLCSEGYNLLAFGIRIHTFHFLLYPL